MFPRDVGGRGVRAFAVTALACLATAVVLAACGSSSKLASSKLSSSPASASTSSAQESSSSSSPEASASAGESVVSSLPQADQAAYEGLEAQQPVGKSPWANFKPKHGPPWVIGYSSEYAGNVWRLKGLQTAEAMVAKYKKAGLISKMIVLQSNLNDAVQIQQIHQLVNDGVDAIFSCCTATSALNPAIAYAHEHGVPFVIDAGFATSPYAINFGANQLSAGEKLAQGLAEAMHEEGNVLDVLGVPGTTANDSMDKGLKNGMKKYPKIKIVGSVVGNWTDTVVKTEVLKFLATHPAAINGIFDQSPGETGALDAMLQSGRAMVPMTPGGEEGPICYWSKHPSWVKGGSYYWPPAAEAEEAFSIMVRTLEGQGPKIQSIIHSDLPFTLEQVKGQLKANCSTSSTNWLAPSSEEWASESFLNGFFEKGHNPLEG